MCFSLNPSLQLHLTFSTIAVKILFPEEISEIFKSIPVIFKTYFEEELLDSIKAKMVARFNLGEDVTIHSW